MNILFISHLSNNISAGLNWSVPASVDSLTAYDNVLWVNRTDFEMSHWKTVSAYHNYKEFGAVFNLNILPAPFSFPDVVIFEGFYFIDDVKLAKYLRKRHLPYIVVVRGSLTRRALHNKSWFKKAIAHALFFDAYAKHALAIQYLTKNEAESSPVRYRSHCYVLPNGFDPPLQQKASFSNEGIRAAFIGRLDMYHKGLDMLFDAVIGGCGYLRAKGFQLEVYGPQKYDYYRIKELIEREGIGDIVVLKGEITGEEKTLALLNTDVYIMTSRFEGHPMGLVEALAYGVPCMVTPGTNMASEIEQYDAGWVCAESPESIRDTLIHVIEEKERWPVKGNNAKRLSLNYRWNQISKSFHDTLLGLLGRE